MSVKIINSSPSHLLSEEIVSHLLDSKPLSVGVVSAFVTLDGVRTFAKAINTIKVKELRLVAGISHYITHPAAIEEAKKLGWIVRLGESPRGPGIFHPKLIIGGKYFKKAGNLHQPCFVCIGSANLTKRGLSMNNECSHISTNDDCDIGAPEAFSKYWEESKPASKTALREYASVFAEKNRTRTPIELDTLGVSDKKVESSTETIRSQKAPKKSIVRNIFARAAWAGLESFTGVWTFQVEFPRIAGEVINRLVGRRKTRDGYVKIFCPADYKTISMKFSYYEHNNMFRLNIPNNISYIDWVRDNRKGIALIQRGPAGGAPLRLSILKPGSKAEDVVARSHALGTWGKTRSRLYGWF